MIRTFTFSEAGGHPANEDSFAVVRPSPEDPYSVFVVAADGQGGRAGGARASRLACDTVAASLDRSGTWPEILAAADRAASTDPDAGFTTLLGFGVFGNQVSGASCGDSAVLAACGSGKLFELTALQYKNPPVGSGDAVFMPFEINLVRPWRILAMTDGVWKYAGWPRVRELVPKLGGNELLAALQKAARLPGSGEFPDDFTVVLVESGESGP